jgi:hypothetical protein
MRNPAIALAHFGPVYKRKIHVYQLRDGGPAYAWSTNAYRTCRDAAAAARALYPNKQFKASFAK